MVRILCVDDDPDLARFVALLLEATGWEVIGAEDGEQGHERAFELMPDLVLTGWSMPKLSGIDLVRLLRGDPRTEAMPIVMLTAKGRDEDKAAGLEAGANDYIVKPFDPVDLIQRLARVLGLTGIRTDFSARPAERIGVIVVDEDGTPAT
jgi:two-component system phosphate regulon response regulator PhoB